MSKPAPDTTYEAGATDIDPTVLENATCLADAWNGGGGRRFYQLSEEVGDHPPVYAFSKYSREVSEETGDLAETETLRAVGTLDPHLHISPGSGRIYDRIVSDQDEDLTDQFMEGDVEGLLHDFEHLFPRRVRQLVEEEGRPIADIHLNKELRIPIDYNEEVAWFTEHGSGQYEAHWHWLFTALEAEATCLDRVYGNDDFGPMDSAYAFDAEASLSEVEEWRLRAAENHHCGVFKNTPSLAHLAALRDSDDDMTQADMASIVGRDASTISLQVDALEEWLDRAEWMCENRL